MLDALRLPDRFGLYIAGPSKVVEFNFDLAADTAMSVAGEMVQEMSLSHEDAQHIAEAIRTEIRQLTEAGLSLGMHTGELASPGGSAENPTRAQRPSCDWDDAVSTQLVRRRSLPQGDLPASTYAASQEPVQPPLVPADSPPGSPLASEQSSLDGSDIEGLATPVARCDSDSSMLSCCNSGLPDAPLGGESPMTGPDIASAPGILGRKRSPTGFLSPPQDEDRQLPLKKLFENLQDMVNTAPEHSDSMPDSPFSKAVPPEAQLQSGLALALDLAASPSVATSEPAGQPAFRPRRGTADAVLGARRNGDRGHLLAQPLPGMRPGSPMPCGNGLHIVSAPASNVGSREDSPSREAPTPELDAGLLPASGEAPLLAAMSADSAVSDRPPNGRLQRTSAKLDPELKEQRRKLACDAMSKMEFGCLQGLDRFGVARGCGNKAGGNAPAKGSHRLPLA